MADDANDPASVGTAKPKLLSPSEIAKIRVAVAGADSLKSTMETLDNERSGQLSPSHTPGQSR